MKANLALALMLVFPLAARATEEIWHIDNLKTIGGQRVTVIGAPQISDVSGGKALRFDGVKDGVFISKIPFAGASQYTIEILFQPAEGGPKEQRFFHAHVSDDWRALIETRLDGKGGWWLDTFIATGEPGVTLVSPARVHPTDRWFWAALRYDGKTMAHFVNGQKELERAAAFKPFGPGQISLGVRQNKVFWFKGAIREVRFHSEAIADSALQRVPDEPGR